MLEGADEANMLNIFVVNIFHDIWKTVYSKV